MKEYIKVFDALSDETRLRIVKALLKSKTSMCVCEIMDSLSEPQYHISRHLKILENAGIVEKERKGKWVFYSLPHKKDRFLLQVLKGISEIDERIFEKDLIRLNERLALRKNGKVVVGIASEEWKKLVKIKLKGGLND